MVRRGPLEKDTCRDYVLPRLSSSGWRPESIQPEYPITAGRVVFKGRRPEREEELRADYVLEISPGIPIAVVEAKREYRRPSDGLQQAKDYAEMLDLPVALATNGKEVAEFDFHSGTERLSDRFPRPDEVWERFLAWKGVADGTVAAILREPFNRLLKNTDGSVREPRYYQRVAIHRALAAILGGRRRVLLTMAAGTGKTFTALQIVWKMWRFWQTQGESGIRRILYLADRDALVDQPLKDYFKPVFQQAAHRILGERTTSRSIYFSTYQALHGGPADPRFRGEFPPDYFDLIIVDECHRGSARDESAWREILEYFSAATQLGLTATPKRDANVDTYRYFGDPMYSYSLRQGINDGFLAPYRVRRVVLSLDAYGWRPDPGQLDRFHREIPDELYTTTDFERIVSMLSRTEAAAQYLTMYLNETDRMAKMAIFCVDSEHASDMRRAMANANADLVRRHADYAARIVAEEYNVRTLLERFADEETSTPVVATTSKLLSTGIDIPTLHTVVLFKPIRSVVEFKQIIGRGSRIAPDYDKHAFEIIDFTGATVLFEDPDFDGPPEAAVEDEIDEEGGVVSGATVGEPEPTADDPLSGTDGGDGNQRDNDVPPRYARKYYVDSVPVYLTADAVYMTDPGTDRLHLVEYRDYVAAVVRRLFATPASLRRGWRDAPGRAEISAELAVRGIDLAELSERAGLADADPFDVLVHVAWNEPVLTRHDRARRLRRDHAEFFQRFQPEAREVLDLLVERYALYGVDDLADMRVLELEPISELGTVVQIADRFGTPQRLRDAVAELQRRLYAA